MLQFWLENADSDLPSFNRTLLFRKAKDIGPWFTTVEDCELCRVLTIVVYWHFVGVQTSSIVLVVILDIDRVKSGQKLCWYAIMKRLSDFLRTERVQGRIPTIALLLAHVDWIY